MEQGIGITRTNDRKEIARCKYYEINGAMRGYIYVLAKAISVT
jgi:hypothetical protein